MKKIFSNAKEMLYFALVAIVFSVINCATEDTVAINDAQSQIYSAAKFAADKCNTPLPNPPLLVVSEPIKRNLDLCTIAITRTGCPFLGYPLICTLIYLDKDSGDIPWWLNFNGFSREQIK